MSIKLLPYPSGYTGTRCRTILSGVSVLHCTGREFWWRYHCLNKGLRHTFQSSPPSSLDDVIKYHVWESAQRYPNSFPRMSVPNLCLYPATAGLSLRWCDWLNWGVGGGVGGGEMHGSTDRRRRYRAQQNTVTMNKCLTWTHTKYNASILQNNCRLRKEPAQNILHKVQYVFVISRLDSFMFLVLKQFFYFLYGVYIRKLTLM